MPPFTFGIWGSRIFHFFDEGLRAAERNRLGESIQEPPLTTLG